MQIDNVKILNYYAKDANINVFKLIKILIIG